MRFDDQSYSPEMLRHLLFKEEAYREFIKSEYMRENVVGNRIKKFSADFYKSYKPKSLKKSRINNNDIVYSKDIYDVLILRRTKKLIDSHIKHVNFSRDDEVRQLTNVIDSYKKINIFRTDIENFYGSIDFSSALGKLKEMDFKNDAALQYMKNIASYCTDNNIEGLPRGLGISASLSEMYMQEFDRKLIAIPRVLYYSRYADDMVVITSKNTDFDIIEKIRGLLPDGLKLNVSKTKNYTPEDTDKPIEYLGYSFTLRCPKSVSIATKKIDRYKKRLILSLKKYLQEKDFDLLYKRIKFITGTSLLAKKGREKPVRTGIRFNYSLCGEEQISSQLKELDTFLSQVLHSKRYSVSCKIRSNLKPDQFKRLCALSFEAGFHNVFTKVEPKEVSKIKEAWCYGK